MNKEVVTFASMQGDHRRWDYDHSSWRSDIEHWRGEHELALAQLARLQEIILQHGEGLQSHAEAIEQHQQSVRDHDRLMSEYQTQGGSERLQETLAEKHASMLNGIRHNTKLTSRSKNTITPRWPI